jgi:hypothetical protein
VHFLELSASSLDPFAPSLNLGFPLERGALIDHGALVAADQGVAYIEKLPNDTVVFDRWLETDAVVSVSAASEPGLAVAVGTTTDASPDDVIYRIDTSVSPPEVTPPALSLAGTPGGVRDVALTSDGSLAVAINGIDDTLVEIPMSNPPAILTPIPLPPADEGARRVVISRVRNFLAILCETSKTVSVYTVDGVSTAHFTSLPVDPRAMGPADAQVPVDVGFAPPDHLVVLLADGAMSSFDLNNTGDTGTMLRGSQAQAGTALIIQP